MKRFLLTKLMLLLCAVVAGVSSVWAEEVEIASFSSSAYYGGTTNGWTVNKATYASTGGGYHQLTYNDRSIVTPSITWDDYTSITIKITARKYGGPTADQLKISVKQGSTELTTYSPSGTSLVASSALSISPTGTGSLTISCPDASGNKGSGISAIVIKGTASSKTASAATFANTTPSISFPTVTTYSQTATTAAGYDGVVTYEITANSAGATIEGSTVTVTQEGTVTVKATAPSTATYSSSTATYTLTVSDTRSAHGLEYVEDTQTIEAGNVLPAPTLTNPNNLDVTYSSSNEDIATVDASGNVTGVAIGETTITASFAGNGSYKSGSASYTIKVKRGKAYNEVFYESFDECASEGGNDNKWGGINPSGYISVDNADVWTFDNGNAAKGCAKFGTGSNGGSAEATLNLAAGTYTLKFKAGGWNKSGEGNTLSLSATNATLDKSSVTISVGAFGDYSATLTVADAGEVSFSFYTSAGNERFFLDEVQLIVNELTPEVTYYGWATYIPSCTVQFPANCAYVVTEASVSGGIKTTAVTKVPANTPVLLKGEGDKSVTILDEVVAAPATNLLSIGTGTTPAGKYAYVLAKDGAGKAGFKQWTGAAAKLEGRVVLYLDEAVAAARSFFSLEDEATGIKQMQANDKAEHTYYNLNGQQVSKPTRGLYIVDGKKVLVK